MRREYHFATLGDQYLPANPNTLFRKWFTHAVRNLGPEAFPMSFSTVNQIMQPTSRMVLLKDYSKDGFVFASHYQSRKAVDLVENPFASILFYWAYADRQVRIEGKTFKTSSTVSDAIFNERPYGSRISSIISRQSQPAASRDEIDKAYENFVFLNREKPLKRPAYWGGYILKPQYFEFWQGRPDRLHDRISYSLAGTKWIRQRLYP